MSLIHNERVKYLATWLNGIATAAVAAGVISPLVAITYGFASGPADIKVLLLATIVWFATGAALHFIVRVVLGRLKP
jgi:hypothetical protein